MPKKNSDDDRMSMVEIFLQGSGVFKKKFKREVNDMANEDLDTAELLIIPAELHCMKNTRVYVGKSCVDMALLTRKNLSNYTDVKDLTLFRHAKEVEANCKKALVICLGENRSYKNGTFPSGKNWYDYIQWVQLQMNGEGDDDCINDVHDDNADSDVDGEEADTETDTSNAVEFDDEQQLQENSTKSDLYFRGFFSFALWGFIPPEGGDVFKSSLIGLVIDKETNIASDMSRSSVKEKDAEDKKYMRDLENRGCSSSQDKVNNLSKIMIKGRKEMQKQKFFRCRISKVEFQMKFAASRVNEIREEISEMKEESDCEEKDTSIKRLKMELKKTRDDKQSFYNTWNQITEAEVSRRTLINIKSDEDVIEVVDGPDDVSFSTMSTYESGSKRRKTVSNIPGTGHENSNNVRNSTDTNDEITDKVPAIDLAV